MVFVSTTFNIDGVSYVVTDESKAAEIAAINELTRAINALRFNNGQF